MRQRVLLRYIFWSGTRASPLVAPYVFYGRGDGLATDDNANVDVTARIAMLEQSVDGNRCPATAQKRRIVENVEHFFARYCKIRGWLWYLLHVRCGIHFELFRKHPRKEGNSSGLENCS